MSLNKSTREYDGGSPDLPNETGDVLRAHDYVRDQEYLQERIGASSLDLFGLSDSVLVSGGVVSKGTGDTLDITATIAMIKHQIKTPDDYSSNPPTVKNEDTLRRVVSVAQTDMAISSATLDGATVNYIKLRVAETDGSTRTRLKSSGTYAYERVDSYSFVVDSTSGTIYDLVLATLVGASGGVFTFSAQAVPPSEKSKLITGPEDLSLPATAVEGATIDVHAHYGNLKIIQTDAEHAISWRRDAFSTKGVTGYLSLVLGDAVRMIYRGVGLIGQDPTKISDPSTLPASTGWGAAWSPDGRYLAIAHDTSPYVTIYDWTSGSPVKISDPSTLPTGIGYGAIWSPDGRYLAIAHDTTPFVTIYDWVTGSPVKISDPSTLPAGVGRGAAWSPDGRYLAIAHSITPFVTIYDWVTGSPVKISDPSTLPASIGWGAAWSPNSRYLVVGHSTTPFVTIYDWATGSPVKISNPGTLPASTGLDASWSPDGRYLVVTHETTPFVTIYDWATGSPVKISNPGTLPTGIGYDAAWSPDGRYLAIAHLITPFVTIYDWATGSPVKISNPGTLPASTGWDASWSPDGRYLAIGHDTTPFVTIYETLESVNKLWIVEAVDTQDGLFPLRFK